MRKTFFEEKPRFLKINKAKPLQLKRNLLIEKYIDSYIIENKNQNKFKNSKIEENKENYYPRKTQVIKQKLSIPESEDTQSTTLNLNSTNKMEKSGNKLYKYPLKVRTKSSSGRTKINTSNIVVYKKNIVNDCFLKNASNLKKNHSYNKNIIQKYDRNYNYMSKYLNEYNNISSSKNQNNSLIFAKKLKRENTFTKFSFDPKSIVKHNRYFSNNSIKTTLEKTLIEDNNSKNNINMNGTNKIHKEINIEDFLLIEKKFEALRDLFSNLRNKNKNIDEKEILNSINFHIYDLYKFYMNSSLEGSPENLFSPKEEKTILHEYSIIFIIGLSTIFINNQFNYDINKNIILLNIQQKLFLLFCDALLKKLNSKYNNNIWVNKLLNELNNKLIFNIRDHLVQIKLLSQNSYQIISDILQSLKLYIKNNYNNIRNPELIQIFTFLFDTFFSKDILNYDSISISTLEELFNKNIFKYENKFSKNKILNDINCINNEYYNINKYDEIDTKVPYLKFPCKKEYTLILDLDETLICFKSSKNDENIGNIHIRPGLEIFLEIIKEFYEIIIFTVGTREYANIILDLIEKKNKIKYFDGRLYREHATKIGNKYIKDLSKIGRDLSRTLIVDNNPHSFKFQHENGILISSYFGEKNNDRALIELQKVLLKIYKEKGDVRELITKYKEEIIQKISCSEES
jgi:Dullard-like phosphatase family protein